MPRTIKNAEQRVAMMKMMLEIMRGFCLAYFKGSRFGSCASDLVLLGAIFVGQAEGRPMNASKLADFAGMPRPTVIRRLAVLIRDGVVARVPNGFEVCTALVNSPAVVAATVAARKQIAHTSTKLSKLDATRVAVIKPNGLGAL